MEPWKANTYQRIQHNTAVCAEYDDDILDTLKECESWRRKVHFISPQLKGRNSVVELIRQIGEQYFYRRATVHLAIHLLDLFMSNHYIVEKRLNLVALTCFYIACKIEENEPNVPSPRKLSSFVEDSYMPADFIALEVTVLNFFNWHVTIPTAATFLDVFVLCCLHPNDLIDPPVLSAASFAALSRRVIESSLEFLDVTLLDPEMNNVKPSLLAAACIAAARCITPNVRAWSRRLTSATGYDYQQIHRICSVLVFDSSPLSALSICTAYRDKHPISDLGYPSESEESNEEGVNIKNDTSSSDSGNRTTSTRLTSCSTCKSVARSCSSCKSVARSCSSCSSTSRYSSCDSQGTLAKRQKLSNDWI